MSNVPQSPGVRALEKVKEQKLDAISQFKVPTNGSTKKLKPKILTEERYVEELSKIIQRDFFPDLEKLRAQNDYLDAESCRDFARMDEIRAKYTGRVPKSTRSSNHNRASSPPTFETPVSTANSTPRPGEDLCDTPHSCASNATKNSFNSAFYNDPETIVIPSKISLDTYLQRYTSEDNQSFQEIIDTAEAKLRKKFEVLYQHEKSSIEKLQSALILPSIERQFAQEDSAIRKIDTWSYTNKNSVMYIPDGVELTDQEKLNAKVNKQTIKYEATRFSMPTNGQTEKPPENVTNQMDSGKKTPRFGNYELLRTPSPCPGVEMSPIMTWGDIDGTPFRLDGGDTPIHQHAGPSFKITENSRRENIALELAEKAGEKLRAQKQINLEAARKNINSPFIRSNMDRLASMSPAAQHLATKKLGLCQQTPTPKSFSRPDHKKRYVTMTPNKIKSITAKATSHKTAVYSYPKNIPDTGSSITDNLLNLPKKRRKATDFF